MGHVESINAITLNTYDMPASVAFYEALGFRAAFGGPNSEFVSLASGGCFVNLVRLADKDQVNAGWGRVIFHVDDVDALYERALASGLVPQAAPRDAPWGERMFPIFDPCGHDLSFAKRL
jgi:catechol 2,3-dioxygenase-like lactoylglutathione lyase family enzyme